MLHVLTSGQVEAYHRDGFVVVPGLVPPDDVARARALIEADLASGAWASAPYAGADVTTDVYERMPELAEIVLSRPYVRAMDDLFGPDAWILAEPAIHRGRYYGWHKDSTFLDEQGERFHWQDDFAAAMTVLYLQDNHPAYGGGLTVVPGTQHAPDVYHRVSAMGPAARAWLRVQKALRVSHGDRLDRHPALHPIPSSAGDLIVLDMRVDHRGTPARKAPPVPKYGIMNIACRGEATARRLSAALRRRPSGYYRDYLAQQPERTPVLERLAREHDAQLIL